MVRGSFSLDAVREAGWVEVREETGVEDGKGVGPGVNIFGFAGDRERGEGKWVDLGDPVDGEGEVETLLLYFVDACAWELKVRVKVLELR